MTDDNDEKKPMRVPSLLLICGSLALVLAYIHRLLWAVCAAAGSQQLAEFAEWATWVFLILGGSSMFFGLAARAIDDQDGRG